MDSPARLDRTLRPSSTTRSRRKRRPRPRGSPRRRISRAHVRGGYLAGDAQLVAAEKEDCVDAIKQLDFLGGRPPARLVEIEIDDLLDTMVGSRVPHISHGAFQARRVKRPSQGGCLPSST